MNAVTLLLLVLAAAVLGAPVLDDALIEKVNSANSGWTAGRNAIFEGKSVEEAKAMLGALPSRHSGIPVVTRNVRPSVGLPTEFNSFDAFPTLNSIVKNQEQCGSCWAFSATSVLGYRFNIEGGVSNSTLANLSLSPQDPVSCDSSNMGCQGGYLPAVWQYMSNTGVRTAECVPYTSGAGSDGVCTKGCSTTSVSPEAFFAKNFYHVGSNYGTDAIRSELVKNGPVQAAFTVYQDFMAYTGGVYTHQSGAELGGHAITIVGYGTEPATADQKATPYWLVQNSWGNQWGISAGGADKGFFKIAVDTCDISAEVYAGLARV